MAGKVDPMMMVVSVEGCAILQETKKFENEGRDDSYQLNLQYMGSTLKLYVDESQAKQLQDGESYKIRGRLMDFGKGLRLVDHKFEKSAKASIADMQMKVDGLTVLMNIDEFKNEDGRVSHRLNLAYLGSTLKPYVDDDQVKQLVPGQFYRVSGQLVDTPRGLRLVAPSFNKIEAVAA